MTLATPSAFDIKAGALRYLGGAIGWSHLASGAVRRAKTEVLAQGFVTPVFFHNPTRKNFLACILWLRKNGYVFLSFDDLLGILDGRRKAPDGSAWISFDDGWREMLDNVIPAVRTFDIPVTLFISTDPVERTGVFWQSLARRHAGHLPPSFRNHPGKLRTIPERERAEIVDELERRFLKGHPREALTIEEIAGLSRLPQITIGSHGVRHAVLPRCTEGELEEEIGRSGASLRAWTGQPALSFSFPFGEYEEREKKALMKADYLLAATTEKRFIVPGDEDRWKIPRLSVPDKALWPEALSRMTGVFNPFVAAGKKLGLAS